MCYVIAAVCALNMSLLKIVFLSLGHGLLQGLSQPYGALRPSINGNGCWSVSVEVLGPLNETQPRLCQSSEGLGTLPFEKTGV